MIEHVTEDEFIQRFVLIDRKENFSVEGRRALFNYFEEELRGSDEDIEFDPIAICVKYSEYESLEDFNNQYGSKTYKNLEELQDETEVIRIDDSRFIVRDF